MEKMRVPLGAVLVVEMLGANLLEKQGATEIAYFVLLSSSTYRTSKNAAQS
jgi:hypothetical protein